MHLQGHLHEGLSQLKVIGTKGRTGLKRFFLGGVANGVIQHGHGHCLVR